MKLLSLSVAIAGAALLPPLLFADAPPSLRPPSREKAIWEPAARLGNRVLVPGFFRPAERTGYLSNAAQRDDYGRYFPGYWEPVGP
ncbi:MAG: hypothetical protein NTV79_10740, partial [Candidatus Aureabacteria bacterium]|nr:hypothetical protein [Candidatus Auribacterota bacterium]